MVDQRPDPDYRDMREGTERLFVAPHAIAPDGFPVMVMPGSHMTLGRVSFPKEPGVYHATVTVFALGSAAALCFIPSADELEALSEAMAKEAKRQRDGADQAAAAAIAKAGRKS